MSRYEWERGTIAIPSALWANFRTTIIKAHNDAIERDYKDAMAALPSVEAAGKGLRGNKRVLGQFKALASFCRVTFDACQESAPRFSVSRGNYGSGPEVERAERLYNLLFVPADKNAWERTVLRTPKKKDLGLLPLTKDAVIDLNGDASITLKNKTHSVSWYVGENNHACDRAREHALADRLFRELGKIEWTRGSGGKIIGNDEYNRDSDCEDGGGNYVTASYEYKSPKEKEKAFLASLRPRSSFCGGRW